MGAGTPSRPNAASESNPILTPHSATTACAGACPASAATQLTTSSRRSEIAAQDRARRRESASPFHSGCIASTRGASPPVTRDSLGGRGSAGCRLPVTKTTAAWPSTSWQVPETLRNETRLFRVLTTWTAPRAPGFLARPPSSDGRRSQPFFVPRRAECCRSGASRLAILSSGVSPPDAGGDGPGGFARTESAPGELRRRRGEQHSNSAPSGLSWRCSSHSSGVRCTSHLTRDLAIRRNRLVLRVPGFSAVSLSGVRRCGDRTHRRYPPDQERGIRPVSDQRLPRGGRTAAGRIAGPRAANNRWVHRGNTERKHPDPVISTHPSRVCHRRRLRQPHQRFDVPQVLHFPRNAAEHHNDLPTHSSRRKLRLLSRRA